MKRWLARGRELQALERARTELDANQATTPVNKTTIQAARSQWFKVVSLVLSNLEMSRAPARDIEIIRGPVLRASDRAGKRYASAAPEEAPLEDGAQGAGPGPSKAEPGGAEVGGASELP
ncbi:hypothetical protein [Sorangium sp. So ce542]|uniref:hypothetical protein n=1 Tax=Sorangium sp. So ce542 TaxID=3133316 RepID=UPI003F643949